MTTTEELHRMHSEILELGSMIRNRRRNGNSRPVVELVDEMIDGAQGQIRFPVINARLDAGSSYRTIVRAIERRVNAE